MSKQCFKLMDIAMHERKISADILRSMFVLIVTLCLLQTEVNSKCQPNEQMKYDLNYTSQLVGYHSLCSEFAKRTCCSGKNFEILAKKISSKLTGPETDLSVGCRRKLTNLMCSVCDSEFGQGQIDGVCESVCQSVYENCKQDFFSIDSLGKVAVCKEEDLVCSKLKYLVSENKQSEACELFGMEPSPVNCWNGKPTHTIKGTPKRKADYKSSKSSRNGSKSRTSSWIKWLSRVEKKYIVYLAVLFLLLSILAYKWASSKYRDYSRQIKNM